MDHEAHPGAEQRDAQSSPRDLPAVAVAVRGVALIGVVLVLLRLAEPVLNPILLMLALERDERTRWAARIIGRRTPMAAADAVGAPLLVSDAPSQGAAPHPEQVGER